MLCSKARIALPHDIRPEPSAAASATRRPTELLLACAVQATLNRLVILNDFGPIALNVCCNVDVR
jgi:hypothetical protein